MKYYWLIVILIFTVKLLGKKELSSYNIKWMVAYVIYLLWLQVMFYDGIDWNYYATDYTWKAFIIPLSLYLVFPFAWKLLSRWKIFLKIEEFVDSWYNTIKNLC